MPRSLAKMRKREPYNRGKQQRGRANGQLVPVTQLLGEVREHGPRQIGGDSGKDCLMDALIGPN